MACRNSHSDRYVNQGGLVIGSGFEPGACKDRVVQASSQPITGTCELPDGRVLAFTEWGAADGVPVIYHHGTPSSRLEHWPDDSVLAEMRVRLVTFDRPGYGVSDPLPGRTLLDVAADVEHLADHLGLERFFLSGMSGGGPFVLATASVLGERVIRSAISCGLGPLDRAGALEGMNPAQAEELEIAREHPQRLAGHLEGLDLAGMMPEDELAAFGSIPGPVEMMLPAVDEAMRQGWAGVIADDLAFVGPWGFDLKVITTPLLLWHGDRDSVAPCHHSAYVAEQVPSALLKVCPGEGHVAMFTHQTEVLEVLVAG